MISNNDELKWDFSINYKDYWEEELKWGNQKKKTFVVSDVNDYSIFINKNLKDIIHFRIKTKHSSWYEPTQIISTEAGSILFFNECIKDIFKKGCIYPARVVMEFSWYYKKLTATDLTKALKNLYKPKKSKKRRKRKPQFQTLRDLEHWEWEIVSKPNNNTLCQTEE